MMAETQQHQHHADVQRIHERIDHLAEVIGELSGSVQQSVALCAICRPKVLGNGLEGYDARLARVETSQIRDGEKRLTNLETTKASVAWFTGRALTAAGIVATVASLVSGLLTHFLGRVP
jgi:hypothetical protein